MPALQVDLADVAQRAELHPGVCGSGRDAAMTQVVTHLLHRQAMVEEMLGRSVSLMSARDYRLSWP